MFSNTPGIFRMIDRAGIVQYDKVILKSGKESNLYVSFHDALPSIPRLRRKIVELMADMISVIEFDLLAPIPTGAVPLATDLSTLLDKPMITPRITVKDHGIPKKIDGIWKPGQTVLIIDDVITEGGSIIENGIHILEEAGLEVRDAVVIVDREEGGSEALAKENCTLHALWRRQEFLAQLKANQGLTEQDFLKLR